MIPSDVIIKILDYNFPNLPLVNKFFYFYFKNKADYYVNKIKLWYKKYKLDMKLNNLRSAPILYTKKTILKIFMKFFSTEFLKIYSTIISHRLNSQEYLDNASKINSRYECYLFYKSLQKEEILYGVM